MKRILKKSVYFLLIQLVFLLFVLFFIINYGKDEAQLMTNAYYHPFFDAFFFYLTQTVEVWGPVIIILSAFLFKSNKLGIVSLLAYAVSGLTTQLLKRQLFDSHYRPTANIPELRLLPSDFGLVLHSSFSFPSGHSTTAFSLMMILTLLVNKKYWGILFGMMATLIAFSRVYLSQHYWEDIAMGSVVGTIMTLIVFSLFEKVKFGNWGSKRLWMTNAPK